ncbi:hypothetical protein [Campylobacter hyointestinalis]|uniref:3-oxoacyl-(Acyl carrier protein) synthase II n=1 Tax=Campylobacter hyointestinalis subsp. hyointestinalis TaxID=91352 RepID=A0A9W5AP73_CAMHY|nr:hypothetical protein [Campylobacter hyointestinalis]CUU74542.1 3-oxoacyl-(acyl carrier protein) synthase II [Campylobacter hyointestinalis subsp. hyointestinalis]CUU82360.1 3-oxoacyl-(acyl carrier protein) synthase II [Campylobacter hyointestinalis subsp. hyointestinalis]
MSKCYINSYVYEYGKNLINGNYYFNFLDRDNYPHVELRDKKSDLITSIKPYGKSAFLYISNPSVVARRNEALAHTKGTNGYVAGTFARDYGYDFDLIDIEANMCSSGASAIEKAFSLVNNGFDSVVIFGANFVDENNINLFKELRIDIKLTEAFACLLVGNAKSDVEILGANVSTNIKDTSTVSLSAKGYKKSYEWAKNIKIDGVKAHGTQTKTNNEQEQQAIKESFGECKVISYKQDIGHSLEANNLVELGIFLDSHIKGTWLFSSSAFGNIYANFVIKRS